MLYREIIAVCSQIHTKHINTLCGQDVVFVSVELGGTYGDDFKWLSRQPLQTPSLILPWTRQSSRDVLMDADFLCHKDAVLVQTIKETSCSKMTSHLTAVCLLLTLKTYSSNKAMTLSVGVTSVNTFRKRINIYLKTRRSKKPHQATNTLWPCTLCSARRLSTSFTHEAPSSKPLDRVGAANRP
jgi:hypothetical protein